MVPVFVTYHTDFLLYVTSANKITTFREIKLDVPQW